jgi:cellulose synthase operon protein C
MNRRLLVRLLLACLLSTVMVGCARDPNVRKQKYFESAARYFAEGLYGEARIQYSKALEIDSRFAPARYQLARTYLKLGDYNNALQELTRTVELDPGNYPARIDLANLLLDERNPDGSPRQESLGQAQVHLKILRDKQPNSSECHQAWAHYYAVQGKMAPAMQEMQQAIALDPNRAESYLVLGDLERRSGMADQAEANFKKAVQVDPKSANTQLALGSFYQSHNRLADAEEQFKHAIETNPKDPDARAALVAVLVEENKTGEIESFLQKTKKDLGNNSQGYRMLGDYYFASGNLDQATAEYGNLYREHSNDLLVKRNYIQLLILKNRVDEANKLNDEILKSSPRDVNALVYKGEIELRRNDAGAAVETLETALQNDPGNAIAHYQLGLAFDQQNNSNRAESEWREAVRLRPDLTDAQRALATMEALHGNYTGLLEISEQLVKALPNAPDGFLFKCIAETGLKRYTQAIEDAQDAMQRAPQSPAPYIQMGHLHVLQKQYAEAEKNYQQALEKDPASSDALSGLMKTYVAQNQYDKAIAAANAQIAKAPANSNFYDLLGTALFDGRKDLTGAQTALRRAIQLDKGNPDAIEKLAQVEYQAGSADQALAVYQQAIRDNPRNSHFYLLAGELYESKQQWDQAKSMYQQALTIQPDEPHACNNLAYVMLEQGGNVDVALAMAESARRAMPSWPNAADTLGWAYYRKGIYQSAISQFQEALRLGERDGAPDDPVVHYHLGLAYQKANQSALARQHLERAIKLSPNNDDARKALSQLRG